MNSNSLLEQVQGLLERTYDVGGSLPDVGRFIIGDRGYRKLYTADELHDSVGEGCGHGARTLVREDGADIRVAVYFPDAMISRLECHPPQCGVGEANVDAFATLVEELDHLLCIAEGVRTGRAFSMFELELHANISKYLVLSRFLAGPRSALAAERRTWLRFHLFEKREFTDADPRVKRRYRDATRWAVRLLDALQTLKPRGRIGTLRHFHRRGAAGKLELIRHLAA